MKRVQTIYAMGTVRGRSTHFLATRETNFRRARKTIIDVIRNNKRWSVAVICKVIFNSDGTEKDLKEIWRSNPLRYSSKNVYVEKV